MPSAYDNPQPTDDTNTLLVGIRKDNAAIIAALGGSASGGAIAANQDTGNASLASIDGKTPAKGSATSANSSPVVIASDQTVPVSLSGVALAANQITGGPQTSGGAITATTQRVTLATDGPGVANLTTIASNTGTTATNGATAAKQDAEAILVGPVTETAPATDTASSGLNGRLQRIAQRLTSLIGLLPTALGSNLSSNSLSVAIASDQGALKANNYVGGAVASSTNQVPTNVTEFEVSVEITRPANTTAYSVGQLINGNGASTLPTLDLGAYLGISAKRNIQISRASILSSNGAASTKLSAIVALFNVNNPAVGGTLADQQTASFTYAAAKAAKQATLESLSTAVGYGTACYEIMQTELMRTSDTDASCKLYAAIIANNAYTPASGETLLLTVRGYLLN